MPLLINPYRHFTVPPKLIDQITSAGLLADLVICLDAGDDNSYSGGSSQDWTSVAADWTESGEGNLSAPWRRGSGTGSDSADPTFNGTAGDTSSAEYFSFDGGDYFENPGTGLTDTHPIQKIHNNNADFTIMFAVYPKDNSGSGVAIAGDGNSASNSIGYRLQYNLGSGSDSMGLVIFNLTYPGTAFNSSSGNVMGMAADTPIIMALSCDESISSRGLWWSNGSLKATTTINYSSPNSNAASYNQKIGVEGAANQMFLPSGTRLYWFCLWDTALSVVQMNALYAYTKVRLGLA